MRKCRSEKKPGIDEALVMEGETYLAIHGDWLFLVEDVLKTTTNPTGEAAVYYIVLQDGRKCKTTLAAFAARVRRRLRSKG